MQEIRVAERKGEIWLGMNIPREIGRLASTLSRARRRPDLAEISFIPSMRLLRMRDSCSRRGHLECTTGEDLRIAHGILAIRENR
jgi:hypothetical protein